MNLLLDTCVLLWLANQDTARLSKPVRHALDHAWVVYASAVSAWEIGLKSARGRVLLPEPLETWWPRLLETHQMEELPLHAAEAARATRLPPIHQDPADRLLIGAAVEHQLTLVTPDQIIAQYPNLKTLW